MIDTATVTPDPEVAAVVAEFEAEFTREMDVPLGTTAVELDSRNATVRTREAAIGNLIADAMRASTKADVAIMNGGGIRAGKVYPPGSTITRRDVLAELPFDNRVVTVEITGADAQGRDRERALATAQRRRALPAGVGHDHRGQHQPPARQPRDLDPRRRPPLDEKRIYRVATNDFLSRGGDGYTMFADAARLLPDARRAAAGQRCDGLHPQPRHGEDGVEGRIVLK